MKSKHLLLLVSLSFIGVLIHLGSVSAYPKTQDGFKQSLEQAADWTIANISAGKRVSSIYPTDFENMLAYYKFNNDSSVGESYNSSSGFIVHDYSGNGNNAVPVGDIGDNYSQSGSYLGDGLFYYDGIDNQFIISESVYAPNQDVSFSLWINVSSFPTSTSNLISFRYASLRGIGLQTYSDGDVGIILRNDTATGEIRSAPQNTGEYLFIVATYDATSKNMKLYINSEDVGTASGVILPEFIEAEIGGNNVVSGSGSFFNGTIDEVVIYNKTLSFLEMRSLYQSYRNREDLEISWFEEGSIDGWNSWKPEPYKDNLTVTSEGCLTNYCLNWTYNYSSYNESSESPNYRIIVKSFTNLDASEYTGIGFWYKSDKINHFTPKIQTWINSTTKVEHQTVSGGEVSNYYSNNSEWKYYYYDFSWLRNGSSSTKFMPREYLSNITQILIVIFNSTSPTENIHGEMLIDNISFVNFDEGGTYRTLYPTMNERNGRYQEGIYNLAYLYYNGHEGYIGNETFLNGSVNMGDWLVRNQLLTGGWQEYGLQTTSSSASTGFPGISFMKALELIKDEPIMQEEVTTYRLGNITTKTRIELWNETAELMANYTLNFNFPSSWYSNQYIGHLHATWLYANYSGKWNIYNDTINEQLTIMNNSWQLNRFGFTAESNSTNKIGIDIGYHGVTTFMTSAFYVDSLNPILRDIIEQYDKSYLHTIGIPNVYTATLINGSRDTGSIKTIDNKEYSYAVTLLLNSPYLKQAFYNRQQTTNSFGDFSITTFSRGNHWDVMRIPYILEEYVGNDFKFPQNYTYYSYNLFNETSWTRNNASISGAIQSISQLEFPQVYYAWDNETSWWSPNKSQGFTLITNYDAINNLNQTAVGVNALIFNTNNSLLCNGLVTGNCNITLPPGNASYVLDNFNLTEGVTRENSPISINPSSNSDMKIFTNTLTDNVNGIITNFNVRSCEIDYIYGTGVTFAEGDFSCLNNVVSLTYDTDYGTLTIEYTPTQSSGGTSGSGVTYTDQDRASSDDNVTVNETLISEQLENIKEASDERKIEIIIAIAIVFLTIVFIIMVIYSARN